MRHALGGEVAQVGGVDLFDFELDIQEFKQVAAVVGAIDALHQRGFLFRGEVVTGTVGMQDAGQFAIDLAHRQADLLFGCRTFFLGGGGLGGFAARWLLRVLLVRFLAQFFSRLGDHLFHAGAAILFVQTHAEHVFDHILRKGLVEFGLFGVAQVAIAVVQGDDIRIMLFVEQIDGQFEDHGTQVGPQALAANGVGAPKLFVKHTCHGDALGAEFCIERYHFAGYALVVTLAVAVPFFDLHALVVDLLDQALEFGLLLVLRFCLQHKLDNGQVALVGWFEQGILEWGGAHGGRGGNGNGE